MTDNKQLNFNNKFNNKLGEIPELEEMTQFNKIDNKSLICIQAKLEVLEMLGGIVDSLREGLTRQLVINNIKDEEVFNKKLNDLDVVEKDVVEKDVVEKVKDVPSMKEVMDYVDNQFKNE